MPIEGKHNTTQNDDGVTRDAYEIIFSNGALEQLRDLADFFTKEGLLKKDIEQPEDELLQAIKISIGISETFKKFSKKDKESK
jgi:hypothetical protein